MPDPWATLRPLADGANDDDNKASIIMIFKDEFSVGKSETCDHLLRSKKMISERHFVVRKISGGGGASGGVGIASCDSGGVMAELEDCSTNGTMLNRTNLVKGTKVSLRDGE